MTVFKPNVLEASNVAKWNINNNQLIKVSLIFI